MQVWARAQPYRGRATALHARNAAVMFGRISGRCVTPAGRGHCQAVTQPPTAERAANFIKKTDAKPLKPLVDLGYARHNDG